MYTMTEKEILEEIVYAAKQFHDRNPSGLHLAIDDRDPDNWALCLRSPDGAIQRTFASGANVEELIKIADAFLCLASYKNT